MTEGLQSKVCVVTGASSGIGEATALRLAGAGATVALVARRDDRLEALAKKISEDGGKALPIKSDITQEDQARAAIERTQ
jgi:NADP-dependent 3-hydroxy acid dehydrogenase YdfG